LYFENLPVFRAGLIFFGAPDSFFFGNPLSALSEKVDEPKKDKRRKTRVKHQF
jgi:hypothetical protein